MGLSTFLGGLVGSGVGQVAKDVADVIDKFVQTKEEKEAAELLRQSIQQRPDEWQVEINKIEAAHRTIFVAGWRPAVGWVCVMSLFWGWILAPILQFLFPGRPMPAIEVGQAVSLVMAMLGMGALRSYEKAKGITG